VKLYEAIELGSGLVKENYENFLRNQNDPCGCALGAAYMALFPFREWFIFEGGQMIRQMAPYIPASGIDMECPVCAWRESPASSITKGILLECLVNHLHHRHRWPRQKIADWLKPIEDEYERQHPAVDAAIPILEEVKS
jgi:hypothetical protein